MAGLTFVRTGDDVRITGRPTLPGLGAVGPVEAVAAVSVVAGALHVSIQNLSVNGAAVAATTAALVSGLLSSALVIPPLPYGLEITSVQATDTGLRLLGAAGRVRLTPP